MPVLARRRSYCLGPGRQFGASGGAPGGSLSAMIKKRIPFSEQHAWQDTTPGMLTTTAVAAPGKPGSRVQPPLQEVLQGLEARVLEGETVFDQLFGPWPEGDPRLP